MELFLPIKAFPRAFYIDFVMTGSPQVYLYYISKCHNWTSYHRGLVLCC